MSVLKNIFLCIILCAGIIMFSCSKDKASEEDNPAIMSKNESIEVTPPLGTIPGEAVSFKSIIGKWRLQYSGNYGYYFNFQKNYKALVILYLGPERLVFKGVYSVDVDKIKINIYEMKREKKHTALDTTGGFLKANSSSFLFRVGLLTKNNHEYIVLAPITIRIDGNNSDGYFEPLIKLKKEG